MKTLLFSVLAVSLLAFGARPVQASDPTMAWPTCSATDPAVGVNTVKKTYLTQKQIEAKSAGMTKPQIEAMIATNHVKVMCLSKAHKMGAKPALRI